MPERTSRRPRTGRWRGAVVRLLFKVTIDDGRLLVEPPQQHVARDMALPAPIDPENGAMQAGFVVDLVHSESGFRYRYHLPEASVLGVESLDGEGNLRGVDLPSQTATLLFEVIVPYVPNAELRLTSRLLNRLARIQDEDAPLGGPVVIERIRDAGGGGGDN